MQLLATRYLPLLAAAVPTKLPVPMLQQRDGVPQVTPAALSLMRDLIPASACTTRAAVRHACGAQRSQTVLDAELEQRLVEAGEAFASTLLAGEDAELGPGRVLPVDVAHILLQSYAEELARWAVGPCNAAFMLWRCLATEG